MYTNTSAWHIREEATLSTAQVKFQVSCSFKFHYYYINGYSSVRLLIFERNCDTNKWSLLKISRVSFLWPQTTKIKHITKGSTHLFFSNRMKSLFMKFLWGKQRYHKTHPNTTMLSLFDVNFCKMCWVSKTTGRIAVHKSQWKITGLSVNEEKPHWAGK